MDLRQFWRMQIRITCVSYGVSRMSRLFVVHECGLSADHGLPLVAWEAMATALGPIASEERERELYERHLQNPDERQA